MGKKFKFSREHYSLSDSDSKSCDICSEGQEVPMVKSTYVLPADRHESLRILKARVGRKLNDLLLEAVDDLLYKYNRNS